MTDQSKGPSNDPRAVRRADLRRAVFNLILAVVALDAVALAIWYFAGISQKNDQTQMIFTVIWTIATALTVAVLLKRVRAVRMR